MAAKTRAAWTAPATSPPTDDDRAAVRAAVLDYYEGWYEADPERMARALHPGLAKRSFAQDPAHAPALATIAADQMVAYTRLGGGRDRGVSASIDLRIEDISGGIASVTAHTEHFHEYLHLVRTTDGWRIVNVLWKYADGHGPGA
jgi:hypothetical protein